MSNKRDAAILSEGSTSTDTGLYRASYGDSIFLWLKTRSNQMPKN